MTGHATTNRVGISVGPSTLLATDFLQAELTARDFVVEQFESGTSFETALHERRFVGVVDWTLMQLVADLLSGPKPACSHRLTAAAATGTPMVIVPGGCDIVVTKDGPRTITGKEVERLAKDIAQKASASSGPVGILVPTLSWSATEQLDREVLRIFVDCLRLWLSPTVRLRTIDMNLGSPEFGQRTAEELACLISGGRRSASC